MNRARNLPVTRTLLTLAACLLLPVWSPLAQESGPRPGVSNDPADKTKCKRQLNRIFGAIREYRKDHGNQLPDRLAELTPDYIYDSDVLVCPFALKRGGLRAWKHRMTELSADPYTSYGYEFPPDPAGGAYFAYYWRGLPMKTSRDVKERQTEVLEDFGDVVPILRCHEHSPELNLSVGGPIYESGRNWEEEFGLNPDLLMNLAYLFPSPEVKQWPKPKDFPPRDPSALPQWLDLTASYNATLTSSWQGFGGNDLAGLPIGIQEFDGVRFDVRGVIQLRCTQLPVEFPARVDGIQVRQKCARIHFLHAMSWIYNPIHQATYSMHYADGEEEEFSIVYGQQIADWWQNPLKPVWPKDATVAWSGQNEAAKAYGMSNHLYHAVWNNPRTDAEIESISIDTLSKTTLAGPFVVAITLE
jgi:hypothetical protein